MDSQLLLNTIIWIGIIASLIPFTFKLFKVITDILLAKFFPIKNVEIRYKKIDGTILIKTVSLDKKSPLVAQLNLQDEKYGH